MERSCTELVANIDVGTMGQQDTGCPNTAVRSCNVQRFIVPGATLHAGRVTTMVKQQSQDVCVIPVTRCVERSRRRAMAQEGCDCFDVVADDSFIDRGEKALPDDINV